MIVCPQCAKENQDHYKFCLGCGGELPRDVARKENQFRAPTPAEGMEAASRPSQCPQCGSEVPANFKFCGSCGHVMKSEGAPEPAPPAAEAPSERFAGGPIGAFIHLQPDGSPGARIELTDGMILGRNSGGVFEGDLYASPDHLRVSSAVPGVAIEDLGSVNGVFLRLTPEVPYPLKDGSVFRIGQEIIRFEAIPPVTEGETAVLGSPNPGFLGRLALVTGPNRTGNCFCIPPEGLHLGRERGDIIFPDDGYVSGLHCRVHYQNGEVVLTDLGSSNGSYLCLREKTVVQPGSLLLVGQQLLSVA
ncbi:MAG: FHA domain-containing protein [Sandaracinaceae bacterium]|nr:FHA domain-containing protein [Sandaracinaceae bacterium]